MRNGIAFFVILCTSCTTIKYIRNEKIVSYNACMPLLGNNSTLVKAAVEGKQQTLLFDTGAMVSMLVDSSVVENLNTKKFGTFGSFQGANGVKKANRIFTTDLGTPLFTSLNKVMLLADMPISKCQKQNYAGILGLDAFFNHHEVLKMDFTSNEICNINSKELETTLQSARFVRIKSKCKSNQVYVIMQFEGKDYQLLLDTGFSGTIIFSDDKKLRFSNQNKMVLEGQMYKTISGETKGCETFYERMPTVFADQSFETKINVSTSIKGQNVGFGFIRCYDWLIDYENNKVYVRRNQNPMASNFNRKISYYAKAGERLTIMTKEISQEKYQIGDEITTVNGTKVTPENSCEMQDLLNKTEDWNTLQLEVIPKA